MQNDWHYCQTKILCTYKRTANNLSIFDIPLSILRHSGFGLHNHTLIKFWSYKSVPKASYILHLIGHVPFFFFFVSSNTIPVNMLYFKSISILMHDVFNKLSPSNICNLFDCWNEILNYNTRFSLAGNYYIKYARSNQLFKSFSRLGAKIWNGIPQEFTQITKTRI